MSNDELGKCEIEYSSLEDKQLFSTPLIVEQHLMNGVPGRPFDLPSLIYRERDTGFIVLQGWQDKTGAFHRLENEGEFKPAVIRFGKLPMCEWYHRGWQIKLSHADGGYADPQTGQFKHTFQGRQGYVPNWEQHLSLP